MDTGIDPASNGPTGAILLIRTICSTDDDAFRLFDLVAETLEYSFVIHAKHGVALGLMFREQLTLWVITKYCFGRPSQETCIFSPNAATDLIMCSMRPIRACIALVLLALIIGPTVQGSAMAATMSPAAVADMSSPDGCDGCGDDNLLDEQCPDVFCAGFSGIVAGSDGPFGLPPIGHEFECDYSRIGLFQIPELSPPRA
ncbi:MAG: hypothetical protein RIC16_03975 [Rhodospirillales bacterium]